MPEDKAASFQACLERLRHDLAGAGNSADAAILGELQEYLAEIERPKTDSSEADHQPIFAVCAAYITAQTMISVDEAVAAQTLARRLVGLGYVPPKHGGDTRGWKRLLLWRDQLERGRLPIALREVYDRALKFARRAPMDVDVKAALDDAMAAESSAASQE